MTAVFKEISATDYNGSQHNFLSRKYQITGDIACENNIIMGCCMSHCIILYAFDI